VSRGGRSGGGEHALETLYGADHERDGKVVDARVFSLIIERDEVVKPVSLANIFD
jgi:hypothetical protein